MIENYFKIRTQRAEYIKDNILKQVKNNGINANGRVDYNGSAILIEDDQWLVRMWIRLIWSDNLDECTVYMSNIAFNEKLQRRGNFTSIINKLKRTKYVNNIVIQSVSTPAMRNWCEKYKFKKRSNGDWDLDYYWKA